ncbi:MAG: substrate-binding domain-containing protein [Bacilli bacterium]|nr:substrate-binding domain-containing protein [Bacilli bacterium]
MSNDLMCYGFYKAVRELNKKIPDDISVIGFDDLFFSNMLDVPLTTIRQPVETIAVTAAQILLEQIKGNQTYKNIKFQPELIIRKSVRKVGD